MGDKTVGKTYSVACLKFCMANCSKGNFPDACTGLLGDRSLWFLLFVVVDVLGNSCIVGGLAFLVGASIRSVCNLCGVFFIWICKKKQRVIF